MTYPAALAHDPILPIADGVFAVRGGFQMGRGIRISRTMTIVATDTGLVLFNAMRLTDSGLRELETLGTVKHLVKLSDSHGVDEPFYVERYRPTVWALEKCAHKPGVSTSCALGPEGPVGGGEVLSYPGTSGWAECGYWIPHGGGTLIACDALQNHSDTEHTSFMARWLTPLMGFKGGLIVAPMWRKYQKIQGAQVREAFRPTLERSFQNLIPGHGPAIIGGADDRARVVIEAAST
jgi:hypothetical protein